ncbi:hypothetical protein QR52_16735 [Bordetella pertussis]|nr:hypothetical protein UN82_16610 [Bordetella pertussis]AOB39602.1 hypothetical protein BBB43_12725 [Bordetella parapertussis]MCE7078082.1 hypothetical protein [Bordetella bronchiseptica]CAE32461.1 hypothetical protein BB1964 [Bordetella bronchiseptica RB50]CCJ53468.1 hypothetical protein BN112_1551 [Bordetella bronchiseptica 253]CCJ59829.1 hypothetical protein BN115_3073 [Bordetella bronchiseptica MO149]CCN05258.1 hypothetical protein BN116_3466 [Bordetella bronchiseptica Bbr77]CCN18806.1 
MASESRGREAETMSEPAIAWRRVDDYCWVGPPGWTICRVWLDGSYQYELWFSRGDAGTIYGMRASLEGAQHLYMQKLG